MLQSCSDEILIHVTDGFLRRDRRNIVAKPAISERLSQKIEVRVALADLEVSLHVIANDFICDIVLVFHWLLHCKFFPSWVERDFH